MSKSLEKALETRDSIALATGVLMVQDHLDPEAARMALLQRASTQRRRMVDVAHEILADNEQRGTSR